VSVALSYPACYAHAPYSIAICGLWALPCLPTLCYKQNEFRCVCVCVCVESHWSVFWISLQLLSQTFLILRTIRRDTVINVHSFLCKIPVIFVRCYSNFNLLDRFSKKSSNIEFRTDMRLKTQSIPAQNMSIKEPNHWVFYSSGLQTDKRTTPIYTNSKSVIIFIRTWCLTLVESLKFRTPCQILTTFCILKFCDKVRFCTSVSVPYKNTYTVVYISLIAHQTQRPFGILNSFKNCMKV